MFTCIVRFVVMIIRLEIDRIVSVWFEVLRAMENSKLVATEI